MEKKFGKIKKVNLGLGGYQDAMVGYNFTLGGKDWGVNTLWKGHWSIPRSPDATWTEEDRIRALGETFMELGKLISAANKLNVEDLVGVPVEATFDKGVLQEWRILEEVL